MCVCVPAQIPHIYVLSNTFEESLSEIFVSEKRIGEKPLDAKSVGEKPTGEKSLVMAKHKGFL